MDWTGLDFYAFPPPVLLGKVLAKIRQQPCRVTLVAPSWAAQAWFPPLLSLLVQEPVRLPLIPDLLSQRLSDRVASKAGGFPTSCVAVVGVSLQNRGFSKRVAELVSSSKRQSTERVYQCHWRAWVMSAGLRKGRHTFDRFYCRDMAVGPDGILRIQSVIAGQQVVSVDVFLRRAFFSSLGKIHCLAYADLLRYETEEKVEKKFIDYIKVANAKDCDYKLVVLCSSENEFRARLVAALDHHRCQLPIIRVKTIKDYLTEKFTAVRVEKDIKSASYIDFSQSTVRIVKSKRAGIGKTLYKKRRVAELRELNPMFRDKDLSVSIPLYEKNVVMSQVADKLLPCTLKPGQIFPRIFHLNISYEVQEGLDYLLFNLLILGKVSNERGHIWLRSAMDLYLVEIIPISDVRDHRKTNARLIHPIFEILPHVTCWSPQDSLQILTNTSRTDDYEKNDLLFDVEEFRSVVYQRPFQYLFRQESKASLSDIDPLTPQGDPAQCLITLLRHCGVPDPSWAELHHFVWFLNTQLCDFERSVFCSPEIQDDLPGFSLFVLKFLIQMSRDFATRSLNMSEETPEDEPEDLEDEPVEHEEDVLSQFQMRRTWESSPHPYIFFNPDGQTMTFLGFNINRHTGDLIDQQTGKVLERRIMPRNLQTCLHSNKVPLNENFDQLQRMERLEKLYSVMAPGFDYYYDPDPTYELTTDNVKKILAIYMRFRCNIPVLIMGETGCGKTRLVKFLCSLQCPPGIEVENMVIMKVHGGTTADDIIKKVHKAERLAQANAEINAHMYTVLFFDEANTTESIGLIKEIMCDGTMDGRPLQLSDKLKIVAACNPYRKHSDELIQRLEKAGLGYHVDAEKTTDRLGRVPMRRLVYRVQPLPQSMLPLVWDFGQLNTTVEELYIRQMVNHYVNSGMLPRILGLVQVVSSVLIQSQSFLRKQEDECSFVSLRDVERVLKVMSWFYQQSRDNRTLFKMMEAEEMELDEETHQDEESEISDDAEEEEERNARWPDDLTKSLILALGVCYRAALRNRDEYDDHVVRFFQTSCSLPGGVRQFVDVITRCQDVFLENVQLEENIARNRALKENLFMMIICIELRIPLFLVGKPGSSKSLAKTIVSDAMQGNTAREQLFKELKQAQMVSFQCSPLSVAEGILGTFRQCAQFQKDKDLDRFVSIVVLDEVGLAEDSVRMPLKTLHPLLEDGCHGDETPEPYKKVAFIGISNWALDPAKMNRGILVQREVPDETELLESAKGICASNPGVLQNIKRLLPEFADAYKAVFETNLQKREFFGLRDFYSLVKMVYAFVAKQDRPLCWHQLEHSVLRNFGGLDTVDPVKIFQKKITTLFKGEERHEDDPVNTTAGLIEAALFGDGTGSESRYLLLLTENYGALGILQQMVGKHKVVTIFGSSFPKDQEYTQVCRNINRIKVCMETGHTVILLNLENLYESLYDALNQYYSRLGGERFVDLGLGTHRVKCRVHKDFRLIVVAEKQIVYEKFPIPLINRLEKHFLRLNNIMNARQSQFADELYLWANQFVTKFKIGYNTEQTMNIADAFMGYHPDTTAAIVLHMWDEKDGHIDDHFLEDCKKMLLWSATPHSVLRLEETRLFSEKDWALHTYFTEQPHDDICSYIRYKLDKFTSSNLYAQVTTHSKLLTDQEKKEIMTCFGLTENNIILLTLQSFDTEQQFCQQIKTFVEKSGSGLKVMLIQCGSGDKNMSLIKSAQYCVEDELLHDDREFAVFFIVQLSSVAGGCFTGFMAGKWHSLHIDELRPEGNLPSVHQLHNNTPANVLQGRAPREEPTRVTPNDTQIGPLNMDSHLAREVQQHEEMELTENIVDQENEDSAAVDLDNIVLEEVPQEEVTPMDVEQPDTSLPAYFQNLILRCIQSAAALVKDDVQDSKRSTKRIEILLHFLEDSNYKSEELSFLVGLSNMIIRLLEEKEVEVSGPIAAGWLAKEAAKPDNVKKAGTFRRSWLQCLENKIITVLAGVVAFLDTNRNLDIIREMPNDHWAHILWLRILHSPSACQLHYKDLLSPETHQELGEIIPYNTGVHGMPFTAELPFSWLLQQLIENALTNAEYSHLQESEETTETNAVLAFVSPLILETSYGKLLNAVSAEIRSNQKNIIVAYVKDFVHTKYLCSSQDKHQILCEALEISSRQVRMDITSLDLMPALVAVHCTHSLVMGRLQAFQDIEQVWPQVLDAVCQMREQGRHALIRTEELTLDVLSLILLLEQLEPQKEQLNKEKGRAEWLEKVKTFSPVIQRIIDNVDNVDLDLGPVSLEYIQIARCLWTRVITMKLFLESFSAKGSKENKKISENFIARCMPLWKLLGAKADLKTITSLDKVEVFLKSVNMGVFKKVSEKLGSCSHCESPFQAPPIMLPCKDKICNKCYNDLQALDHQCCPKCHQDIPANFNDQKTPAEKNISTEHLCYTSDISAEHQLFQRCCNTFLMSVVSNLCFGGNTAPEDAVIERILTYITRKTSSQGLGASERLQTKQMTVFDDLVDPTPVVRSFLLKLLIHKSGDHVQQYLEDFLKQAEKLGQQTLHNSGILQFILMVIQCLEDQLHETAAMKDFDSEMKMATQYLSLAYQYIESANIDMAKLQTIANARFGLMTVAKYLHMLVIEESIMKSSVFTKMLSQARDLIEIEKFDWPKKFFIKQLCREFGTDSYHRICQWGKTPWLAIEEPTEKVKECPDRYVVCSLHYQKIRDMVAKTLLGEDVTHLESIISEMVSPLNQMYLFLAIHREVTLKYVQPDVQQDQALAKAVENLDTFADNTESISNIDLHQLLQNRYGQQTHLLNFQPGQSLRDQSILCMLFHFSLVLRNCPEKKNFLHPLIAMAKDPALFTDTLLPTMPQDDTKKMKAIILESVVKEDRNAQVVVYRCPNGHPYVITECGRPYTEGRCNECGSKIGGVSHKAFEGNVQDSGIDQTKTGHILGDANQRPNISPSERKLSGQACALLRLLTHAALLLGCDINLQAVSFMVQPTVQNVCQFFWDHIQKDIEQLHRGLGKSVDDIFLILHFIFHQISDETQGVATPENPVTLSTKEEREDWEEHFSSTFISPCLQDLDNLLQMLNDKIIKDNKIWYIGQDKLLNILYEVETTDVESIENLHNIPDVWRYRSRITLDHFLREFQLQMENAKKKDCNLVLRLFQSENYYLQAMQYIPSILTLQRHLMLRYRRRLDRVEGYRMTIKDVIRTESHSFNMQELFDDFTAAWECVKEKLLDYGCWSLHGGLVRLPQEFRNVKITPDSQLAILLPSMIGPGLCSYILLEFLLRKHNEFLDCYCVITKQSGVPEVQVKDLKANHLVCYHPDKDLLPLVLANCNYSFKLGEGTKVEYDFDGFEHQLKERLLQAKSKVHQQSGIIPLETMLYRADTGSAVVFETLRNKVKQEALSPTVRLQVSAELRASLPDICDSIDNLDIAVCFLKSLGDDGSQSLQQFMTDVLKMKQTIASQKARQVCKFKHVQSLWLFLNLEKSQVLAVHNQDAFDNLGPDMKKKLSDTQTNSLVWFCRHQILNKLEFVLQEIFDCILLRIAQPQAHYDEDTRDQKDMSLRDIMHGNIDSPLYDLDSVEKSVMEDITDFPDDIKGSQATEAWLTVYKEIEVIRRQAL
ncbi:E3 ubiquitin-protein ligase rnf213-alpha-like [Gigantopelta aegis]|uniref:E3 ubiquitin-protein ligase rnf213-alpha-like n=1 Tax=Gigantopelta aegis TaxID=1735272 RepID=UPI001B888F03|nr:E3 ubiquitin-protein ligase rnf213-alpha-like [Gigantopelta aegis]